MVNALLDALILLLQAELGADTQGVAIPKNQWHRLPLAQVQRTQAAQLGLYLGKLAIAPSPPASHAIAGPTDFQQTFWIDVQSPQANQVETLTSLIVGTLLLSQSELIAAFNQLPKGADYSYTSKRFGTRHRLRQIQFIDATHAYEAGSLNAQLQFLAIGQIDLAKLTPDERDILTTITATGTLGKLENGQLKGDVNTQWDSRF